MTNREAIASEIEPYSLSEDAYEIAFIKAKAKYGISGGVDDTYSASNIRPIAYAGMLCLAKLITLTSENVGGISQSYRVDKLLSALKSLAKSVGLSADLVLDDDSDQYGITAVQAW